MIDYQTDSIKQRLRSINNKRCLTKCEPVNTPYLHPIIFAEVNDTKYNTCAIDPTYDQEENRVLQIDKCNLEDNDIFEIPDTLSSMFSGFNMSSKEFLSTLYNINSFEQAIYWMQDNEYLPLETLKRIQDASWRLYGTNITNVVYEFYYKIALESWIPVYLIKISDKYKIIVSDNDFIVEEGKTKMTDSIKKIIINKYFTYEDFIKIVDKFIKSFSPVWPQSYYDEMRIYCFKYMVAKLKKESKNNLY